jgi:hypothetical protein
VFWYLNEHFPDTTPPEIEQSIRPLAEPVGPVRVTTSPLPSPWRANDRVVQLVKQPMAVAGRGAATSVAARAIAAARKSLEPRTASRLKSAIEAGS